MNKVMNTKIWLIIIALMHTFMGVLIPILEHGNADNLGVFLYFFVLSVHLFYVIIFTKNQTQDRLGVVLCAPMVIWFVFSAKKEPEKRFSGLLPSHHAVTGHVSST